MHEVWVGIIQFSLVSPFWIIFNLGFYFTPLQRHVRCLERLSPQKMYHPLRPELVRFFAKALLWLFLRLVWPKKGSTKIIPQNVVGHNFVQRFLFVCCWDVFFWLKTYQDDNDELGKEQMACHRLQNFMKLTSFFGLKIHKERDGCFFSKNMGTLGTWKWTVWCTISIMLLPFSRVSSCQKISDDCMRDCDSGDHVWSTISAIQWIIY